MDSQWLEEHTGMRWMMDHPFGTHLPILIQCVLRTQKSVLEIGMGEFSTPLLHLFSKTHSVVSIDTHEGLVEACRKKYASGSHIILLTQDYSDPLIDLTDWGVVLVDHVVDREKEIRRVLPLSEYVVVHDSAAESFPTVQCKHRREFWELGVTVMSNHRDLSDLESMW